jgi:hypothetical protein
MALSATFLLRTADQLWTRFAAQSREATGTILSVRQLGRTNRFTSFALASSDGSQYFLHADTGNDDLQVGEEVHADWTASNGSVGHLTVLQGPHAGAHFQNAFPFSTIARPLVSLLLVWVIYFRWRKNPYSPQPNRPGHVDDIATLRF